jgi:hypothetical protein
MSDWQAEFGRRMHGFDGAHRPTPGESAVSIKVRVVSGCFHREDSPRAYAIIDKHLDLLAREDLDRLEFHEHESGPELLVWVAMATAGVTLVKSVLDLVTAIIEARLEGVKQGDHPSEPVELIVRRIASRDEFREETVLRVAHDQAITRQQIRDALDTALKKLLRDDGERN